MALRRLARLRLCQGAETSQGFVGSDGRADLQEEENLKLAVLIVDARHPPTELDLVMKDYLERFDVPFQVVATKVDKLSASQRKQSLAQARRKMGVSCVIPYSSATGLGKKQLWQIIREV